MLIWNFAERAKLFNYESFASSVCIYCNTELEVLPEIYKKIDKNDINIFNSGSDESVTKIGVCKVCGWWKVHEVYVYWDQEDPHWEEIWRTERHHCHNGAIGCLKELDTNKIEAPLEEVKQFLAAKYDSRFDMHPRLFEETVASVFKNLGYRARVTAYSNDNGIDVILDGPSKSLIGVQVKRYKNTIKAEQIRSLSGALLLGGYTKGIFVTTSHFQSGAYKTAKLSEVRGKPIELIDSKRFLEALHISQINRFSIDKVLECFRGPNENWFHSEWLHY